MITKTELFTSEDGILFRPEPRKDRLPALPPGQYKIACDRNGIHYAAQPVTSSAIHLDPDQKAVIDEVRLFWTSGDRFKAMGFPHKRGILLYGPPGTGKSTTARAISDTIIAAGGVSFRFDGDNDEVFKDGLTSFRHASPDAQVLVMIEDIDRCVAGGNEEELLEILDGSYAVDRTVFVATSNDRSKLPDRLVRPSRFDRQIEVGFPSEAARRFFVDSVIPNHPDTDELVRLTKGKSIADLKELIIRRYVLAEPKAAKPKRLRVTASLAVM